MNTWRDDLGQQWRDWRATTYQRDVARLGLASSILAALMITLALLAR